MRPHRFDPLSFVAGTVFVLFAAVLLFGRVRLHDLRPATLWIWPVLAVGGLLTLYGARRLWESRESPAVADEPAPEEEEVS
jgi:hypothetical protein